MLSQDQVQNAQLLAAVVSATSAIVLLLVTSVYVWLTYRISSATAESAKASQRSAELAQRSADSAERGVDVSAHVLAEMERQRLSSSQPLVIPHVDGEVKSASGIIQVVNVSVVNVGNGPALNVLVTPRGTLLKYTPEGEGFASRAPVLPAGSSKLAGQLVLVDVPAMLQGATVSVHPELSVGYSDIYGREFEVVLPAADDSTAVSSARPTIEVRIIRDPTTKSTAAQRTTTAP